MSFKRKNDLLGWLICAVATWVYTVTAEQTASFWDCGEFIAVSFKLMVPHPPGAPFFLLVGRLFSFLALGDTQQVGFWVNMVSVLSSSFTILFLFWSITFLGRKMIGAPQANGEYSLGQQLSLLGASTIGALAYTFSDSFWFSAVEAEVYGMSSFFTAFVVWAMLKWDTLTDEVAENKWLLLITYMMGLSIGVHLLNLVTIPALGLVYYFKKNPKPNFTGIAITLGISLVIIAVVMEGVIPGLPTIAGKFEIFFVNSLGMFFGAGIFFFCLLFLGGLIYGIRYSIQHQKVTLNTVLMGLVFILIGYSSYALIVIRSNADTPINENDPSDIVSFVSYLRREQYGDRPLFYGRVFTSERGETVYGDSVYRKGPHRYESYDIKMTPTYTDNMLLPRVYSQTDNHAELYRTWLGLAENQRPTFGQNLYFMLSYQMGHMYFRYFLWNFAGRDGDEKEAGWLLPWSPTDAPEEIANNKARDNFYMLPLILGLIGLFYQLKFDEKGFSVVGMLFVLTGVALVVYMNSPPTEPRERDYIYVGSFYAFAMWIGLGVLAIIKALEKVLANQAARAVVATMVCAIVPGIMGAKGWDNHNRHGRFHSVDQARNTLASCAPNAILFTGGDNDTFPLWYVQDVEGFRTDVRVIVLSYFNTDWYINQMKRKVYDSEALPLSLEFANYKSGKNDIVYVDPEGDTRSLKLKRYIELVKQDHEIVKRPYQSGDNVEMLSIAPSRNFELAVDSAGVIKKGFIPKGLESRVLSVMRFGVRKGAGAFYKSDLAILDLLANFNWDRPIYFNNTSAATTAIDLKDFLFMEGMTFRLMPIRARGRGGLGEVNVPVMYENLMTKFQFRGFDNPDTYNDDEYRKFAANERQGYFRLAYQLFEDGDTARAKQVLDTSLEKIPDTAVLYDYYMPDYVRLYYYLGETEKAKAIAEKMGKRASDNLKYVFDNNLKNYNYSERIQLWLYTANRLQEVYSQMAQAEEQNLLLLKGNPTVGQEAASPDKLAKAEAFLKFSRERAGYYNDLLNKYYPQSQ
ncbi:MAG: DUF2723 domain-containing protein [Bernardetiaceae bacterium]|nr:DUF2723 domain-containing protein [Bernardetiaceae bacterium]